MYISRKTMRREDWRRILEREYVWHDLNLPGMTGAAGLIRIGRVAAPFRRSLFGRELTLADSGYSWLQVAPRGENWWLTAMFDRSGKIVQYYFDVTLENCVRGSGDSFFYDLFLDVVLVPGAGIAVLDEDELEQALEDGTIDESAYHLAHSTAQRLVDGLEHGAERLEAFCQAQFRQLNGEIDG